MRRDTGFKSIILILLASFVLFTFASCKQETSNTDDIIAIEKLMHYFEEPSDLEIRGLRKYVVSDKETFYYVEWGDNGEENDETYRVLLIYTPQNGLVDLVHFADMEYGLFANVKKQWDEIKDSPDKVFSQQEILDIKQSAIDNLK